MRPSSDEHFVDTNVVIECHRSGCWEALARNYRLATVDKVIEECATGMHETMDIEKVRELVQTYDVSDCDLIQLRLDLRGRVFLDPGEEHLLAHAARQSGLWRICSPDGALVRATWLLGHLDRNVSLEFLLKSIGHAPKRPLRNQYTEKWLSQKRTDLELETN